ncbi:DUF421 domain-containing protein [Hymenobacter sp. BRD128]|uniref:DUF421 domain-containing protein n=1 Tax=Hymenobacter sp. BRD128 TaxID=2675878 RepID=UPI0015656E13|nr:DUF421 domain-containing protein [Hymenobacter sp. BRD128]QKG57805.1 DUF421 domain-containing protein [Hymenobacter sp. BRD128]
MKDFLVDLLGLAAKADTITTSQICWRTLVVFIIALVLLRVSGRRTFASNSGQETVVKFMLGAILSRAIAGDSPFGVIIAAAVALVLLHRLLAYATYFSPAFGRLVKGESSVLAEGATVNHHELRRASFSEEALHAAVRGAANLGDLAQTETVRLEHDGTVSVVKKA